MFAARKTETHRSWVVEEVGDINDDGTAMATYQLVETGAVEVSRRFVSARKRQR